MKKRGAIEIRQPFRSGLLGTALVGWGLLRDWWWLGLLLALLVEAPRMIAARKNFQAPDFLRAFNLSYILLAVVWLILWLQDVDREDFEVLVEALPLFFLPVILCQRFAKASHYPLYAMTSLSNWRFQREGDEKEVVRINFGYLYLVMVLVAASWNIQDLWYKAGFALLVSVVLWRIIFTKGAGQKNSLSKYVVYVGTIALSIVSMYGLIRLYAYLESGQWYQLLKTKADTPLETTTALGKIGKIKLDPTIHWRIIDPEIGPPPLLRDRVFNRYKNRSWYHDPVSEVPSREEDYDDMSTNDFGGKVAFFLDASGTENEVREKTRQALRIRGKARQKTLLPVMNSTLVVDTQSVQSIQVNSLGTYVAENPDSAVLDYTCYSQSTRELDPAEFPPDLEKDLFIPAQLEESLDQFLAQEGISAESTEAEVSTYLKRIFQEDFTYSVDGRIAGIAPIKRFLLEVKRGHCEYYATAGALLLRRLGIPTRYTVGYAVREYDSDRKEWIMRGFHSHAWVRVWDEAEQLWFDVDFTPRSSAVFEGPGTPRFQKVRDSILRWREDIVVWRADNTDSWFLTVLPWFLVLLLVLVFGRNLLKVSGNQTTPLSRILSPLQKKPLGLPPRLDSEPYESWLTRLPDNLRGKEELIQQVESVLYSSLVLDKAKTQELKRLVKDLRTERSEE